MADSSIYSMISGAYVSILRTFGRLMRDCRGATAVEYGILCAVIFFAIMATVQGLANETNQMWTRVNSTLGHATSA